MKTRPALAVLAALPLALAAACSGTGTAGPSETVSGGPSPALTTTATPAAVSSPASSPAASSVPSDGTSGGTSGEPAPPTSADAVKVERGPAEPPLVTGVRVAAHDGYDRVVVELKGAMTGYTADWVDKIIQDGSGTVVDATGGAYLQLTLAPASAHDLAGKPTWKGPREVAANLPNVTRVVNNGDFEGVVSIGLVLARKAPFRITEQSGPTRLVIDVGH
ncbi:hypothetical protein [Microbispora sp. NPDC049125]|uniref:AMIN-like domain-containing (lipo)protein n=1 Tax=Microbispora sp. NPDC049125 TaxID=3154929 RepID=UPI00346683C0